MSISLVIAAIPLFFLLRASHCDHKYSKYLLGRVDQDTTEGMRAAWQKVVIEMHEAHKENDERQHEDRIATKDIWNSTTITRIKKQLIAEITNVFKKRTDQYEHINNLRSRSFLLKVRDDWDVESEINLTKELIDIMVQEAVNTNFSNPVSICYIIRNNGPKHSITNARQRRRHQLYQDIADIPDPGKT